VLAGLKFGALRSGKRHQGRRDSSACLEHRPSTVRFPCGIADELTRVLLCALVFLGEIPRLRIGQRTEDVDGKPFVSTDGAIEKLSLPQRSIEVPLSDELF